MDKILAAGQIVAKHCFQCILFVLKEMTPQSLPNEFIKVTVIEIHRERIQLTGSIVTNQINGAMLKLHFV